MACVSLSETKQTSSSNTEIQEQLFPYTGVIYPVHSLRLHEVTY